MDTAEAIAYFVNKIPNTTATELFSSSPVEGNYCCLGCRQEIKRVFFALTGKYVMPGACKCDIARMEQEEQQQEMRERRDKIMKTYKQNMLNDSLKAATFENFEPRSGTLHVLKESMNFAIDFKARKGGLFIFGVPGNGKSHLASAIHHNVNREGYACLFIDVSQLFNLAKDSHRQNSKVTLTDIITAAIDCDLLTLDEMGSGTLTEYECNDILFPIINGRQGKKTNYTTNLNIERLTNWFAYGKNGIELDIDGRLIDRIVGSCLLIENTGTSKRTENAGLNHTR